MSKAKAKAKYAEAIARLELDATSAPISGLLDTPFKGVGRTNRESALHYIGAARHTLNVEEDQNPARDFYAFHEARWWAHFTATDMGYRGDEMKICVLLAKASSELVASDDSVYDLARDIFNRIDAPGGS